MTTLQAVAFGAMLAWTPSLIILAVSLWDVPELEGMEKPGETTLERRLQTPSGLSSDGAAAKSSVA